MFNKSIDIPEIFAKLEISFGCSPVCHKKKKGQEFAPFPVKK